jgi:hypothetical protein
MKISFASVDIYVELASLVHEPNISTQEIQSTPVSRNFSACRIEAFAFSLVEKKSGF